MDHPKVALSLTRAEAIVFIELLMRFRDKDRLVVEDEAERQLLYDLCCMVEDQLPELFDPRWGLLVQQARASVLSNNI